ncbi:MAG: prepilin-type N-terminal cleavage/methylation domain-containing protein [Gammaproteobacteria bacterium]|nr:MAG: prepilin-type N-terminal cleavage/methylation domain-containing protein [Gammaproteobacteria bacterium]
MERGFTLVELLVTITLLALLLALAVPGLSGMAERQASDSTQANIRRLLSAGREAAIQQNAVTTVCPSRDGSQCSGNWQDTWLVFSDPNGNRTVDSGEAILLRWQPDARVRFVSRPATLQAIQWSPSGITAGTFGSLIWCAGGAKQTLRQVSVTLQGRIRAIQDTDGDGIRDVSLIPATCAG